MPLFHKIIKALFFFITLVFISSQSTYAASEFEIDSKSTYRVSIDGKTAVTHEIELTNKFPEIYVTDYALSIGSTRISSIWAKDGLGFLDPHTQKTSNSTAISFGFKEKSVGLGQTLSFSLGYEDNDVAQKIGNIWEINIPRPEDINEFAAYDVVLSVPQQFKEPFQMTPQPVNRKYQDSLINFTFDKAGLQKRGITAIFGEKQVFSFDLRYSLQNPAPISKVLKIALPPDTPYQKVLYDNIIPTPLAIETDADGNWLASFKVESGQSLEIHAAGSAILYLSPTVPTGDGQLPSESYLSEKPPWQVEDPSIQELAYKLKTPENIYNYIVENLNYNYDRAQAGNIRMGAKGALTYKDQALCMEFTDLFIALSRAAGVPARELNGFAYTQNPQLRPLSLRQDILHSWPEYFDAEKKIWIPIDPTWGNTTQGIDYFSRFDLNHFTFVIHGNSPQLPYPAGFYKTTGAEGKDILITPMQTIPEIGNSIEVKLSLPEDITAGIGKAGNILITNKGNAALHNVQITTSSLGFDILTPSKKVLHSILPYTTYELPIKIKSRNLFRTTTSKLLVKIDEKTYETEIKFKPIQKKIPQLFLSLGLGAALAAASTRSRSLLLSFKKGKRNLRRKGAKLKGKNPLL